MARAVDSAAVLTIVQALLDFNANEARGMSIQEIASTTQITDRRIRTIVSRPELGFREARSRSLTGAVTYYHDLSLMTSGAVTDPLSPVQWEDSERLQYIVQCLANAIHAVDPTHHLVAKATLDGATKDKKSKNWFDWLLSESQLADLGRKAKRDKKWQAKHIIETHNDNMALKAYNMHDYMVGLFDTVRLRDYDPDALFKVGVYLMLAGLNPDEWKEWREAQNKNSGENVTNVTPDED